jgi:hypothetical protein
VATCQWTDPVAAVAGAPWDFVLAADVLYLHSGLAALLPRLVGSTGQIWIADQARPPARDFLAACRDWATIATAGTADPDGRDDSPTPAAPPIRYGPRTGRAHSRSNTSGPPLSTGDHVQTPRDEDEILDPRRLERVGGASPNGRRRARTAASPRR